MNYIPWGAIDRIVEDILASPRMLSCVAFTHQLLVTVGVPENHTPDAEQLLLFITAVIVTLASYWYWLGNNHLRKRRDLESQLTKVPPPSIPFSTTSFSSLTFPLTISLCISLPLSLLSLSLSPRQAHRIVHDLEEKLLNLQHTSDPKHGKEIRIFMDGAFDMMHYGHMNAFRKGRAMGTTLIVGVNSDETITVCKGSPVMNDKERIAMVNLSSHFSLSLSSSLTLSLSLSLSVYLSLTLQVRGCKFVDEVVPGVPYVMNDEYLKWVISEYNIDYVVHGDDPCIVDGKDVYESAQKMGTLLLLVWTI
jgi:ethanolamine-phosphate cytidylyltransferase